MSFRHRKEI